MRPHERRERYDFKERSIDHDVDAQSFSWKVEMEKSEETSSDVTPAEEVIAQ